MNSYSTNYAYLAGMLEGELKSLATDNVFLKMKSEDDRRQYVRLIVEGATIKAKQFAQIHGTD